MDTFTTLLVLLGIACISGFIGASIIYLVPSRSETKVEIKLIKKVQPDEDNEQPLND